VVISLTRINDQPLVLNCELIQTIERDHDTVVTLYGGEKLRVRETPEEIVRRVQAYRRETGPCAPPLPLPARTPPPMEVFGDENG
jgi:flagellar protein FlbD